MSSLLRNILALLAGLVAGVVLISLVQAINGRLYPLPAGFDPGNPEQMKQHAASLPPLAFVIVLASYLAGFTFAVYLATRASATMHARQGVLVAAFFGAASVMNLRAFSHPDWFWVANLVVLLAAVWFGIRAGIPKRLPAAAQP